MSTCRFPEHHNGSGGVGGWLAGLILGAVILYNWHAVIVILTVGAVLAIAGLIVLLSWRAHRAVPYDAGWQDDLPVPSQLASAYQVTASPVSQHLAARLAAVEQQLAARHLEAGTATAWDARPAELHQHVHLHGLTDEQVAALTARQAPIYQPPAYDRQAIEE